MKSFFLRVSKDVLFLLLTVIILVFSVAGCNNPTSSNDTENDTDIDRLEEIADSVNPGIPDDYSDISHINNFDRWGNHNVHDPTLIKHEGQYYMYSTDVMFGGGGVDQDDSRLVPKIPIRRSDDLVNWKPIDYVFDEMPGDVITTLREQQPSYEPLAVWAPFIIKVGQEFRLYYSVPLNDRHGAYLGLATSDHPEGPWENQGEVLPTYTGDQHNGIDPAVIVDRNNGRHWLIHGSWEAGIFAVELNPETGFRINEEDVGKVVATRPKDGGGSAPMEGAEILYRPENDMYYMFVTYDFLMEPYNVRVGRAEQPQGPYYDMFGVDMVQPSDNFPKITAQYRFNNHFGWKGVGHTGLLRDDDGEYYLASQGRLGGPSPNEHLMNLHLRRMLWTEEEWPVLSPQRYAGVPDMEINEGLIAGDWEYISLDMTFEMNSSQTLTFTSNGRIDGTEEGSWSFDGSNLVIDTGNQEPFDAHVVWGWDWENEDITLLFTGLNENGIGQWGKQVVD